MPIGAVIADQTGVVLAAESSCLRCEIGDWLAGDALWPATALWLIVIAALAVGGVYTWYRRRS